MRRVLVILGAAAMASVQAEPQVRPITKVINLLTDMKNKLQAEADEDAKVFKNLSCWCSTNSAAKKEAIADAQAAIESLTSQIEQLSGQIARLGEEIATLEKEVADAKLALEIATATREKELKAFTALEASTLDSLSKLAEAIEVLKVHQSTGFLEKAKTFIRDSFPAYAMTQKSNKKLDHVQMFLAAPAGTGSYNSQSGVVFGILEEMKDQFDDDLKEDRETEEKAQAAFVEYKAAKEEQIAIASKSIEDKKVEKAEAEENKAQAEQDLADTQAALGADQKFLMNLVEKCEMTDAEMEKRTKDRAVEQEAVAKALSILTAPDAQDLFHGSLRVPKVAAGDEDKAVEFLQVSQKDRRAVAAKFLQAAAVRLHKPKLAVVAMKVKLDAFVKVKKAIDEMIAEMLRQKDEEIKQKDFCVEELNQNERDTKQTTYDKENSENEIERLKNEIQQRTDIIDENNLKDKETIASMKEASEDFTTQDIDFQKTTQDQMNVQAILAKVIEVMTTAYPEFLQQAPLKDDPAGPPPPPGFKSYAKQESGGVMALLNRIKDDAAELQKETLNIYQENKKAYAAFIEDGNAIVTECRKIVARNMLERAQLEKDKVAEETTLSNLLAELEKLGKQNTDLHTACDFVLKNFVVTQEARDQEVEALRKAKDILSGASFSNFLQHS